MTDFQALKKNWEGLAQADPLWAICTDPDRKNRQWNLNDFMATGQAEVATVLAHIQKLGLAIKSQGPALDFGCGVGRLTQALTEHFETCYGIDISETMIQQAERINQAPERCHYCVNSSDDLKRFTDDYFGFIYTSIVLQHMERQYATAYIKEFIRILQPDGVLIFQIPERYKSSLQNTMRQMMWTLRSQLALRTRLRKLRGQSVTPVAEHPFEMEMHCITETDIRRLLQALGAQVLDIQMTNSTDLDFNGRLAYLKHEPAQGYVSKQYCVVKSAIKSS